MPQNNQDKAEQFQKDFLISERSIFPIVPAKGFIFKDNDAWRKEVFNEPLQESGEYFIGCDIAKETNKGSICVMKRFSDGQTHIVEISNLKSDNKRLNDLKYKLLVRKYIRKNPNVTIMYEKDSYSSLRLKAPRSVLSYISEMVIKKQSKNVK